MTIRTEDTEQFAWLTLFIGVGRGRGERENFMCDYVIFGLNRRCFVDNLTNTFLDNTNDLIVPVPFVNNFDPDIIDPSCPFAG